MDFTTRLHWRNCYFYGLHLYCYLCNYRVNYPLLEQMDFLLTYQLSIFVDKFTRLLNGAKTLTITVFTKLYHDYWSFRYSFFCSLWQFSEKCICTPKHDITNPHRENFRTSNWNERTNELKLESLRNSIQTNKQNYVVYTYTNIDSIWRHTECIITKEKKTRPRSDYGIQILI